MVVYSMPEKGTCASKEKGGLGRMHKDAFPKKGPCTCRGSAKIQQGATRGTAMELPPLCKKGFKKSQVHCPPGRIQVGLVQTIRKILGAALIASPQYFLPAQDHLCFRVQSMVLTSPGRGALPGRTYINPPTLWLLEDKVWDGGSGSSRMAPAWHLPSSGLSPASQACPDVSHRQKVWTPLTGRW